MAILAYFYTFILLRSSLVSSSTVGHCGFDYGAIHKGKLNLDSANIYRTLVGLRSKIECATSCYADVFCNTAVFMFGGDCLFISDYSTELNLNATSEYNLDTGELIAMRSAKLLKASSEARFRGLACPQECTGTSICVVDCTSGQDPEQVCLDLSASQYTDDGCGFEPALQSKEYYLADFDRESSTNGYTFFTVTFVKMEGWTTLRVKWRGTLRGAFGANGSWGRWKILFNGANCANPDYIESITYNHRSDTSHQKATGIIGICHELPAGAHSITLGGEMTNTYLRAGYNTHASRLFIDELGQGTFTSEPPVAPCPSLTAFNLRQHVTTQKWGHETGTLWNVGYTKMEDETWLRINLDYVIRMYPNGDHDGCATWYIRIDGEDCQPFPLGKTLANLAFADDVRNEHRSVEIEGHCSGISAGYHTLSLVVSTCPNDGIASRDVYTGWHNCRQRFIIEEIRMQTNIVGVMASNGQDVYRIPQFNMISHGGIGLLSDVNNGVVWSIPEYAKLYSSSGLRLTMSSDGRCYSGHLDSNYAFCCRHYFVINGEECADPGTIEGIHHLNKKTNLHRPVMIEGICEGVPAGTVTLTVNAGICKEDTKEGECSFGYNSYVHLMISESYVDRDILQF